MWDAVRNTPWKSVRTGLAVAATVLLLLLAAVAAVAWLNLRGDEDGPAIGAATAAADAATVDPAGGAAPRYRDDGQIARGAYLARAGDCEACHTARGGTPYAGGRPIDTPFGTVYSPNLTPDDDHGLGRWNAAEFRRALRHGRSRDGRLLTPVFPYDNYTRVDNADADALYAYLRSLPASADGNRPHALRFPYGTQAALALWRALYFRPGRFEPEAARPAAWNRGAYLVQGLGHCSACHAGRNALGGNAGPLDLSGGLIPSQNWYAPSLNAPREAGVAGWRDDEVVALLKTGTGSRATVAGPMAEVVLGSTQHLSDADLNAVAAYLKALPPNGGGVSGGGGGSAGSSEGGSGGGGRTGGGAAAVTTTARAPAGGAPADVGTAARGRQLYERHCAACHGADGAGVPGAYPALAGNRAVVLDPPANLVRIVLEGGFAPATAGNPRPFGMPPFATVLDAEEIAAVLSYLRAAWGQRAPPVSAREVARYGAGAHR